jgi:hypothetical protein
VLQAGRSQVRFPMWTLDFLIDLESTHPLTEISTRDLPGVEERPAREPDKLTAICEPVV